jgi:hypothetical protein
MGWNKEKVPGRFDDVQRQAHADEDAGRRYFVFAEVAGSSKK